jgi:hypothetical protein
MTLVVLERKDLNGPTMIEYRSTRIPQEPVAPAWLERQILVKRTLNNRAQASSLHLSVLSKLLSRHPVRGRQTAD